jgi:hypothetical protein
MIFSHAAEYSVKSIFSVTAECWCSSLEKQKRLVRETKDPVVLGGFGENYRRIAIGDEPAISVLSC